MSRPRWTTGLLAVLVGLQCLLPTPGGAGPLRISNLVVTNSDNALLVNVVLLGSLPAGIVEGLGTGIPASVRFQVELWQYNAWWVDRRVVAKLVERQVVFDILTKEYRVTAVQGETREPYVTRDVWEAERVVSEVRTLNLSQMGNLKRDDLYYVRVRGEVRSGAPDATAKLLPFVSSRVETGWEQSPLLTLLRTR